MENIKKLINKVALESANNRISELKTVLDTTTDEEETAKTELEDCRDRLSEIDNIRNSVDQWLSENAE